MYVYVRTYVRIYIYIYIYTYGWGVQGLVPPPPMVWVLRTRRMIHAGG